jgi:hypothetical protein
MYLIYLTNFNQVPMYIHETKFGLRSNTKMEATTNPLDF